MLPIRVTLGTWNISATRETLPRFEILSFAYAIHPNFSSSNLRNNIAVIRLSTPAPLGRFPHINNICLPSRVIFMKFLNFLKKP
jgi:hypothetical protein